MTRNDPNRGEMAYTDGRGAGPRLMRRLRFRLWVLPVLVAVAALALDGVRRWTIDPATSRLPAGSDAVLDPARPGYVAVYRDVEHFEIVPFGSRVEVIRDGRPSNIGPPEVNSGPVRAELREVSIRVLDGKKAGVTGDLPRFYLRPAP